MGKGCGTLMVTLEWLDVAVRFLAMDKELYYCYSNFIALSSL